MECDGLRFLSKTGWNMFEKTIYCYKMNDRTKKYHPRLCVQPFALNQDDEIKMMICMLILSWSVQR